VDGMSAIESLKQTESPDALLYMEQGVRGFYCNFTKVFFCIWQEIGIMCQIIYIENKIITGRHPWEGKPAYKGVIYMAQHIASEIMEKAFVTAGPDTSVYELVNLFVKNKVTAIPIINDEDELVGIVTDADLLYKKVKPHVPHYVNLLGASIYYSGISAYNRGFKKLMAGTAKELMTKDVIIAAPDAPVEQIAGVMVAEHLKVIPIVDKKHVVGIVTRGNILDELYQEYGES